MLADLKRAYLEWRLQRSTQAAPGHVYDIGWYDALVREWSSLQWTGGAAMPKRSILKEWWASRARTLGPQTDDIGQLLLLVPRRKRKTMEAHGPLVGLLDAVQTEIGHGEPHVRLLNVQTTGSAAAFSEADKDGSPGRARVSPAEDQASPRPRPKEQCTDANVLAVLRIAAAQAALQSEHTIRVQGLEPVPPGVELCLRVLSRELPLSDCYRLIGQGSYGSVVRAQSRRGNGAVNVAVKIMHNTCSYGQLVGGHPGSEAAALKYDVTRGQAAAAGHFPDGSPLHNPFTVGVPEASISDSGLMFVRDPENLRKYYAVLFMECGDTTCEGVLRKLRSMFTDPDGVVLPGAFLKVAAVFSAIWKAVASMHALGISHRDIKPNNLVRISEPKNMVGNETTAAVEDIRLIDFGLAVFPEALLQPRAAKTQVPSRPRSTAGAAGTSTRAVQAVSMIAIRPGPVPCDPVGTYGSVPFKDLDVYYGCAPAEGQRQCKAPTNVVPVRGNRYYSPPERPEERPGVICSADFLKGDMWAVGIMLFDVFRGGRATVWQYGTDEEKTALATATDKDLWTKHLAKTAITDAGQAGRVWPEEWDHAVSLLRGLLMADPCHRLSASAALQHAFLQGVRTPTPPTHPPQ